MYYTNIDYKVLAALRDRKISLDVLLEAISADFPYPVSKFSLAHALGKLSAGGYIQGYALTEKGTALFKNNKKFLESKTKANARLCKLLCAEQVDGVALYEISDQAYTEAYDALRRKYSIPTPDFTIVQGENAFILRFAGYGGEDEDEYTDEQSITVNAASICALAHAFSAYNKDGRHHKCCLYADGAPAYVATVSINDRATRLNIAKILYNRQRFIGKRDGDLDYAQCGDSVYDRTDDNLPGQITYALMQAEALLGDDFPYEDMKDWECC